MPFLQLSKCVHLWLLLFFFSIFISNPCFVLFLKCPDDRSSFYVRHQADELAVSAALGNSKPGANRGQGRGVSRVWRSVPWRVVVAWGMRSFHRA